MLWSSPRFFHLPTGEFPSCQATPRHQFKLTADHNFSEKREQRAGALRWRHIPASARTYMLSQNLVMVVGLSWFLRCRNQRWIFRTSQSSCFDKPSNLFPSGDWRKMKQTSVLLLLNLLSVWHALYTTVGPMHRWQNPRWRHCIHF